VVVVAVAVVAVATVAVVAAVATVVAAAEVALPVTERTCSQQHTDEVRGSMTIVV